MIPAHLDERHAPDTEAIRHWRLEQLQRAGYGRREARVLARQVEVDLHQAINLVSRGCSPELALRILL
jgi:hypothetical protein